MSAEEYVILKNAVLRFIDEIYECDETGERLGWPNELERLTEWKAPDE